MSPGELKAWFADQLSPYYEEREVKNMFFIVLSEVLNISRVYYLSDFTRTYSEQEINAISDVVRRLQNYEPIQYVLHKAHFYGLDLTVNPDVLIPRPETEELVDLIIEDWKDGVPHASTRKDPHSPLVIFDIGTGSGCIALALAGNIRPCMVFACDRSEASVECTAQNAKNLGENISLFQWDIFEDQVPVTLPPIDVLVSNPPYVRDSEKAMMKPIVVLFEPGEALFVPDDDPLTYYRRIQYLGLRLLSPGGLLYFEINEAFGEEIAMLLEKTGYVDVEVFEDIHGKERIVRAAKKKEAVLLGTASQS